jgi:hypothetical protein
LDRSGIIGAFLDINNMGILTPDFLLLAYKPVYFGKGVDQGQTQDLTTDDDQPVGSQPYQSYKQ